MIYFTSDTHFSHANIIRYCERPFKDVNHMNRAMIENWNAIVKPEDTVYHLGDFAMGSHHHWPRFCAALNGHKILIRGNHDKGRDRMLSVGFEEVLEAFTFQGWSMVHDPFGHNGKILCGHIHIKYRRFTDDLHDIINVGVDKWDFKPVTFDELMAAKA